jgi:histidinol dehydrogenase
MKVLNVAEPAPEAARLRKSGNIPTEVMARAIGIMRDVQEHGDPAVIDYTAKFDGVRIGSLAVTRQEIKDAYSKVTKDQIGALRLIKSRLEKSELAVAKRLRGIKVRSEGVSIERAMVPISSVGCYIPGGKAFYPSTVVMCAVPAKVAGVKRIVAISPPTKDGSVDPLTLVAADICGVDEFYRAGGAQGIAALAYGTQSIKPVSKIVGPGGVFVTAAKLAASGVASTDMVAGPTELLVYADASANPGLVAADLISQAEHSPDTICGLVTASEKLATRVQSEIEKMLPGISRSDIVKKSLDQNGFVALCRDEKSCIEFVDGFAPEHLQVMCKRPDAVAKKFTSAGLVLVGSNTPSSASDYALGSNHVLPTLGFARSRASLSVLDFVKVVNRVKASRTGLSKVERAVKEIATAEGLLNHYEAVKARRKRG